ncbi:hypothetical protein SH661x_003882 [Planctomicrobium sp. SH661]|uniref:hypothetical protein n=1 Tax=Planctomicrobium sp. SH661 TaxID=3448124 RepID=UPI003F5C8693
MAEPLVTEGELSICPEYGLSKVIAYLQETIADCLTWQGLVTSGELAWAELLELIGGENPELDRAEAVDAIRIYCERDEGAELQLPSCIISHDPRWLDDHLGTATFVAQGSLSVSFAFPIPALYVDTNKLWYIDGCNKLGKIIREIKAQELKANRITPNQLSVGRIGRLDPQEMNGQHAFLGELVLNVYGEMNV